MHVVVSKKELLKILAHCQGVADKKSTMPVLGNVLLTAGKDSLKLSATDLYLAVLGDVPAKVEESGSVAVGAKDLFDRVKMMPDAMLSISTDGAQTTIRAQGSARRYTLNGLFGEEFPALPKADEGAPKMSLEISALRDLINSTHFSISTDETRLHLNSALFEWEGSHVRMVTTDGHRLSKRETSVSGDGNAKMLIPLKGVLELRRLCDEARAAGDDALVTIQQSGPNAFFAMSGFQFSVKLVDAQFPPYDQVIPSTTARSIRAPRAAVADALRAVSIAASDRTGGVKLTLSNNTMRFSSESPESGDGFDEVPVEYDEEELTIGFNARYFLDVLSAFTDEHLVLGVSGELDPATITPGNNTDAENYLAVIMPMRI